MKIGFIHSFSQEYHGIMYLSAVLKAAGHECRVFVTSLEKDLPAEIVRWKPQVVGFSPTTGEHLNMARLASHIKKETDAVTVFGGAHPTVCPGIIEREGVDIVCVGEGEYALLDLVTALEDGSDTSRIHNLWVKRNGSIIKNELRPLIEDLESLPWPDWSLYHKYRFLREKGYKTFIGSRGCPFRCTFCTDPYFHSLYRGKGRYLRMRNPESFAAEIKEQKEILGFTSLTFDDEVFVWNKEWLSEFLEHYRREVGLPFFCGVRADTLTEAVVRELRDSGCYGMSFGIESGNEFIRNELGNKRIKNAQIVKAAQWVKEIGIMLRTTNMFCMPEETPERAWETVRLNTSCKVDHPFAYIFQPLPKTRMFEYARDHGFLVKGFDFDSLEPMHLNDNPLKLKKKGQILNIQKFFYLAVKHPWLLPLLKILVKVPPNPLYNLVFKLCLVRNYSVYKKMSFFTTLIFAIKSRNIEQDSTPK